MNSIILVIVIWIIVLPFIAAAEIKGTARTIPIYRGYLYFGIILVVVALILIGPTLIAELTSGEFSLENALTSIFLSKFGIGALLCLILGVLMFVDMRKKI